MLLAMVICTAMPAGSSVRMTRFTKLEVRIQRMSRTAPGGEDDTCWGGGDLSLLVVGEEI